MELTMEQLFSGLSDEIINAKFKIYKHTSPSGKVYIGQTRFLNVILRWKNGGKGYFRKENGKYNQPAMVNAINKYSWDTWSHEIIDGCNTQKEADALEIYYIKMFKSNDPNFGYNITKGGGGHSGQSMSNETKQKLSKAIKDKWLDPEYRSKQMSIIHPPMPETTKEALRKANTGKIYSEESKRKIRESKPKNIVFQFSLTGEFIKEFDYPQDAANELGKVHTTITNCCKGITKKCGDYILLFKTDLDNNPDLLNERIKNINNKKTSVKPVIQISLNGEVINEYLSVKEASTKTGISVTSISNCLCGYSRKSGGYLWKYKN